MMRDGLRAILAREGNIEVVGEAACGHEAVELGCALSPTVVIMDIGMPRLNGIEATRRLLLHAPAVRVVMLSMHGNNEYLRRALRAGARGYLLKQSAGRNVVKAVNAAARGKRYLDPQLADGVAEEYLNDLPGPAEPTPLESLSSREREVLQLVVEGYSSKRIGELAHLSPKTVETYRARIMRKLGLHTLTALIRFAIEHGMAGG
ncbi:response regulator transcription factor [Endothiovibrio diazotrophicus]